MKLISKWLKAGVMVEGKMMESLVGTPQGGVISPLLANIYLHQMDEIWERENATVGELTRYCDDFAVLSKTRPGVEESRKRIEEILRRLKLELHPEKTRIVELNWGKGGFNFLGWHARKCASVKYRGRYYLNRWPSSASMKKLYGKFRVMVYRNRGVRNARELVIGLNQLLRGWANYFCTGNSTKKFQQAQKHLWGRLALFESKRRRRTGPYWNLGQHEYQWFKGLGLYDLTRKGILRYPGIVATHG